MSGEGWLLTRPRRLATRHGLRNLLPDTLQLYARAVAVPVQQCRRGGASLRSATTSFRAAALKQLLFHVFAREDNGSKVLD